MWSTMEVSGQCSAVFQPAPHPGRRDAHFVQDMAAVLQEIKQCGPIQLAKTWRMRRYYRREMTRLLRVGGYMISDIGLTLADARAAADRPFWRP